MLMKIKIVIFLTLKILNEFSGVLFEASFKILSHSFIEEIFLWEFK
jgi:hypothetical protein